MLVYLDPIYVKFEVTMHNKNFHFSVSMHVTHFLVVCRVLCATVDCATSGEGFLVFIFLSIVYYGSVR